MVGTFPSSFDDECVADRIRDEEADDAVDDVGRDTDLGACKPETGRLGDAVASSLRWDAGRASLDTDGFGSARGIPLVVAGAGEGTVDMRSPADSREGVPTRPAGVVDRPGEELAEPVPLAVPPPVVRFKRSSNIDFSLSAIGPTSFQVCSAPKCE